MYIFLTIVIGMHGLVLQGLSQSVFEPDPGASQVTSCFFKRGGDQERPLIMRNLLFKKTD